MPSLQKDSSSTFRSRWWSLSVASIATLIVTLDSGQLSIALPLIISDFNADLSLASWIALVYALITASLYLPCGRLSDLFGLGKLFLTGFVLYSASSFAAGLAQGPGQLVLCRALQAAGSALIMANNFALVTALFPPEERGRAMGIAGGTISALGYSLGPVVGGLMTHGFGWRSNFYLSGSLALCGFLAARILLPPESFRGGAQKERFDLIGALSFAFAVSSLLLTLAFAQTSQGNDLLVSMSALGGISGLGFFIWWEKRVAFPLLDLSIFRIPAFTLGNAARWSSFIAMSMSNLLMPFFLQFAMQLDPLRAGMLIAPTSVAMALLAPITGWMSEKIAPEKLGAVGLAVSGVALIFLSFLQSSSGAIEVVFGLSLMGVGMGIFQTPNNNLLMSSVPRHRLGVGSSVLSIVRSLGYSIGATLATIIVSHSLLLSTGATSLQDLAGGSGSGVDSLILAAFQRGYRWAFLFAAAVAFGGAVVSLWPARRD